MPKCILAEQGGKGGSGVVLAKIEVTTKPTKTSYLAGDTFNQEGMIVTAYYGTEKTIIASAEVAGYSVNPTTLTDGTTEVTITYAEGGQSCSTKLPVTVTHRLTAIAITTNPTKTTYEYSDTLSTSGMVVRATYSDAATANITNYSCSPTTLTSLGNQVVTVTYTENGVSQTATFNVTVNRKSVTKPTWKSNFTYSGAPQSVNNTSYWNNYNASYMTIGGTTSATNAGTYAASFTPGSNYCWSDGSTSAISVNWGINRATGSLSVSPTSIALNGSNYSAGINVTITRAGDGAISYSPTSVNGLTLSLSGNTLNIKGNGSTAISSQTITISVAQGTNYTAPSSKTVTVSASYWSWGADGAAVDASWFTGLKNYLASHSGSSIKTSNGGNILGTTKSVTLSSAVLGTTTHLIRVIGVDQDADNTVTFQTANCLANNTTFDNGSMWIGSTARSLCQSYYNAFPGKTAIKTVSKGTIASYIGNRGANTVTYNNEAVWLPSEREMGLDSYSQISVANSTTTNAECTYGKNFSYAYYTSDSNRIKKLSDSGSTYWYWVRSRGYNYSGSVCFVNSYGGAAYYYYNSSYGLAPAFVIG